MVLFCFLRRLFGVFENRVVVVKQESNTRSVERSNKQSKHFDVYDEPHGSRPSAFHHYLPSQLGDVYTSSLDAQSSPVKEYSAAVQPQDPVEIISGLRPDCTHRLAE